MENKRTDLSPEKVFGNKDNYFNWGRWVSPVLEYEAWLDWCKTKHAKEFGLIDKEPVIFSIDGNYFIPKNGAYKQIEDWAAKEYESGDFVISEKIIGIAERLSNECLKMADGLNSDLSFDDFKKAIELISDIRFPWASCFPIGDTGEKFLHKYASEKNITIQDATELIPHLPNSLNDDQKKLSELRSLIESKGLEFDIEKIRQADPKLASDIEKHQKDTEYIGTHHFWGDERTVGRLLEAVKNSSPVKEETSLTENKIKGLDIIARATKWRLECAQSSAYLAYKLRPFMTKVAKDHGLEYNDIIFLLSDEIKDLIENNTDYLETIRQRQEAPGIVKIDGCIYVVVGEVLDSWIEFFGLANEHKKVDEFKGSIGSKGYARGVVAIVLKPSDQAKVMPGMVLVAPETTPDYIPSMGKAAAFVTDQGGITSHAAIVAREMRKPCIIGTKIATQVLKDGDMVEVDADNGVVRIIK